MAEDFKALRLSRPAGRSLPLSLSGPVGVSNCISPRPWTERGLVGGAVVSPAEMGAVIRDSSAGRRASASRQAWGKMASTSFGWWRTPGGWSRREGKKRIESGRRLPFPSITKENGSNFICRRLDWWYSWFAVQLLDWKRSEWQQGIRNHSVQHRQICYNQSLFINVKWKQYVNIDKILCDAVGNDRLWIL